MIPWLRLRLVLILLFTVSSIASVIYISVASANYLSFYPSLGGIKERITSVAYQHDMVSNKTLLVAHAIVYNPTDYSDFKLAALDLKVYFFLPSTNATLFTGLPLTASEQVNKPMAPHGEIGLDIFVTPTQGEAARLANFTATYSSQVVAHALLTVEIITFLNPVTGHTLFEVQQDIQLT